MTKRLLRIKVRGAIAISLMFQAQSDAGRRIRFSDTSLTYTCRLVESRKVEMRMRHSRIDTHNPLPPPEQYQYIQLAPGYVKEILKVYDNWDGKEHVPSKLRDLMMVLRIEVSRRYGST